MCESGECKVCGKHTIMHSYVADGYLCFEHYSKLLNDKKASENKWEHACITCYGKGYEEKLSCGCTGYRMRRPCKSCNGRGSVDLLTHTILLEKFLGTDKELNLPNNHWVD